MITRKDCIRKTHYGLKILSYILHQFDPDVVVHLGSQYTVRPTKKEGTPVENQMVHQDTPLENHRVNCGTYFVNPFLQGKTPILLIRIENQLVVYNDIHTPSFCGDIFDFAQLYFKEGSEQQLLDRINKVLRLGLAPIISKYEEKREKVQQFLDTIPDDCNAPKFSYFSRNLYNLYPTATVSIPEAYKMITNPIRKYKTEKLRNLVVEEQKKSKKQDFDYVTFSGIFTKRSNTSLIKHSKLLTVDIDNIPEINRLQEIKEKLLNDSYFPTQLLFTSPRGKGLKWVIEITLQKGSHKEYFEAITIYLKQTYTIEMDRNGADVCRACLLPYDPNAYIHPKYVSL